MSVFQSQILRLFLVIFSCSPCLVGAETVYYEGAIYEGQVVNGKRHGEGKIVYTSGHEYSGEWFLDTKKGSGTYLWPDGSKYTGEWLDDQEHGFGTWEAKTGESYVGDFFEGKRHGLGIYTYVSGDKISGEWIKGEFQEAPTQLLSKLGKLDGDASRGITWTAELSWLVLGVLIAALYFGWALFKSSDVSPRSSNVIFDGVKARSVESKDNRLMFFVAIALAFIYFIGMVIAERNVGIGPIVWSYTAWLIHKKNIDTVVTVQKVMLGIAVLYLILIASSGSSSAPTYLPYTYGDLLISALISLALHSWYLVYFGAQKKQRAHTK